METEFISDNPSFVSAHQFHIIFMADGTAGTFLSANLTLSAKVHDTKINGLIHLHRDIGGNNRQTGIGPQLWCDQEAMATLLPQTRIDGDGRRDHVIEAWRHM
jgi:hypothetical protein